MKILFQSDDYGITKAQALGCLEAIHHGVIRNTGFFSNMPWASEVYEWIRNDVNDIAFGIDLNASTGPSVLPHEEIPHLTHEDGMFLSSRENRALDNDENDHDHLAECRDELYREFDAQIRRFIEITGRKPDYIHNHSYGTKTTAKVTQQLSEKYNVMTTAQFSCRDDVKAVGMGWYGFGGPEAQLKGDPAEYLVSDKEGILDSDCEYAYVVTHCGYVDAQLFTLSSFNTCRCMDLEGMCSDRLKTWLKQHHLTITSFKEINRK